jgi:S-adenosylmethionine hydrolase
MGIITLTTDWQSDDHFSGAVTGRILSFCPNVRIVDLAHGIPPFQLSQAAFVLRHTYRHFPPGTVHICGVMAGIREMPLLLSHDKHFFFLPDNGITGMLFPEGVETIYRLTQGNQETLFPVLDLMVPAACELLRGKKPADLGAPVSDIKITRPVHAAIDEGIITGLVIHIDSYSNLITNITRELFERVGRGRSFEIFPGTGSMSYRITRLNKYYYETPVADIFALFNSLDLLEIGIAHGNAAELLGVTLQSSIRIRFKA